MENNIALANNVNELMDSNMNAFCSMRIESKEDKIKFYNAISNTENQLQDYVNKEIVIKDIYAETASSIKPETGELQEFVRIVIISPNGTSYATGSSGVFSSLKRLIALFGAPTWDEGLKVVVKQKKTKNGNHKVLTLEAVL